MRYIVAITGASGVLYGLKLVDFLSKNNEVYLLISEAAKKVMKHEATGIKINKKVVQLNEEDIDASIASGSFKVDGMVICPCSMKTLAAVANGYANNLICRAADVSIKERRKLILVPREMPFSVIHLENMLKLAKVGVTIIPACPSYYSNPKTIDELANTVIGKILDSLNVENNVTKRWK